VNDKEHSLLAWTARVDAGKCVTGRGRFAVMGEMTYMLKTYYLCGALLVGISAGASGYTSDEMLERCKVGSQAATAFEADQFGYCRGAVQMMIDLSRVLDDSLRFCVPDNYTIEEAVAIVVRHLENTPGERDKPFVVLAHFALSDAWPCK
jgi:Rap1a immunity proteins